MSITAALYEAPEPEHILDIFLQPGEFFWADDSATRIRTLLGSCVAICVWHPRLRLGGMCHYLLPARTTAAHDSADPGPDPRYGTEAMELFLREMARTGTDPGQYIAKVFGGAAMFAGTGNEETVGEKNIKQALEMLRGHKIRVAARDTGNDRDRRIHFELWSGAVWLKRRQKG
jgi:chemotaxis protein CheD